MLKTTRRPRPCGGDGDLLDRAEQYRQKRFARLAEELEANRQRKAKEFDLLEFAVALGDEDIAHFEPVSHWHEDPVTPRQSEFLTRCGINPAALKGKGHACHVIDKIMQRRAAGLATYKQVRTLRKFGVPDPHLISFTRASAILDRLFSERFQPRNSDMSAEDYSPLKEALEKLTIFDVWQLPALGGETRHMLPIPISQRPQSKFLHLHEWPKMADFTLPARTAMRRTFAPKRETCHGSGARLLIDLAGTERETRHKRFSATQSGQSGAIRPVQGHGKGQEA